MLTRSDLEHDAAVLARLVVQSRSHASLCEWSDRAAVDVSLDRLPRAGLVLFDTPRRVVVATPLGRLVHQRVEEQGRHLGRLVNPALRYYPPKMAWHPSVGSSGPDAVVVSLPSESKGA
jgi:hypothetical protein